MKITNNKFLYILFSVLVALSIQGCGQKGDLYLPKDAITTS